MITNPNAGNYLQYDQSFIKNITITNNSELLEEIFDYAIVEDLENDFTYVQNFYCENLKNLSPLSMDTMGILIPPEVIGTNTIFNPYQTTFDFMNCKQIENGKLSFKTRNSKLFQGFVDLDQNLTPLFLYNCLQVNIQLNEYAFFVPVFNARIQDLTNVSVNDSQYEFSRLLNEQNTVINKLIGDLTLKHKMFVNKPRTNSTYLNTVYQEICTGIEKDLVFKINDKEFTLKRCLYQTLSYHIFGNKTHAQELYLKARNFMIQNAKICQDIIAFSHKLGYDEYDSEMIILQKLDEEVYDPEKLLNIRTETQNMDVEGGKMKKMFRFTKKVLYDAYINQESKALVGIYGDTTGNMTNFSSLVDLYAVSEIYKFPIEFYISSTHTDLSKKEDQMGDYTGTKRSLIYNNEFNFKTLEFVSLINGFYLDKPLCRITLNFGYDYGLVINKTEKVENEVAVFIKNEDIFNITDTIVKLEDVHDSRNFLDLIDIEFFTNVNNLSYKETHIRVGNYNTIALFLHVLDSEKTIFPYFIGNCERIERVFKSSNFIELEPYLDMSGIYNNPYYNTFLLEHTYSYSFLNYFLNAKNNGLRKLEELLKLKHASYQKNLILSMVYFLNTDDFVVTSDCINTHFINAFEIENEDGIEDKYNSKKRIPPQILKPFMKTYLGQASDEDVIDLIGVIMSILGNLNNLPGCVEQLNGYKNKSIYNKVFKKTAKSEFKNNEINLYHERNAIMNNTFIDNLLSRYGSVTTYKLLLNLMPDLFDYAHFEKEIKKNLDKAENEFRFDYTSLWVFLSSQFLKKFKNQNDLKLFNPFSKYEKFFSKYTTKPMNIRSKMSELAVHFKNVNFEVALYSKYYMLPIVGYIAKLQQFFKKNLRNLTDVNCKTIVDNFYLDQLRQSIIYALGIEDSDKEKMEEEEAKNIRFAPTNDTTFLTKSKRILGKLVNAVVMVANSALTVAALATGVAVVTSVVNGTFLANATHLFFSAFNYLFPTVTQGSVEVTSLWGLQKILGSAKPTMFEDLTNMQSTSNFAQIAKIPVINLEVKTITDMSLLYSPWTIAGLMGLASWGMYRLYNSYETKNITTNINIIASPQEEFELINNALAKEMMSGAQLFYIQNDYDMLTKNTFNVSETSETKNFANKLEYTLEEMKLETNFDDVENLFIEACMKELSPYTLENIKARDAEKNKIEKSKNEIELEIQNLKNEIEKIKKLEVKFVRNFKTLFLWQHEQKLENTTFDTFAIETNGYNFPDKKIEIKTEYSYHTFAGTEETITWNWEKYQIITSDSLFEKMEAHDAIDGVSSKYFSSESYTIENNKKKDYCEFLVDVWKLEMGVDMNIISLGQAIEVLQGTERIENSEMMKIQTANFLLQKYEIKNRIFKTNLNTTKEDDLIKQGREWIKETEKKLEGRISIYRTLKKMCKYINKKGEISKFELNRFVKNAEKILIYHFKYMHPEFVANYNECDFIFSFANVNKEDGNKIYTTSGVFYEIITDKTKLQQLENKQNLTKHHDKTLTEQLVNKLKPKSKNDVNNGFIKDSSIYFKKYAQKTELTSSELTKINAYFEDEIKYKNLPYLFQKDNWEKYIEFLITIMVNVKETLAAAETYFTKTKKVVKAVTNTVLLPLTNIFDYFFGVNPFTKMVTLIKEIKRRKIARALVKEDDMQKGVLFLDDNSFTPFKIKDQFYDSSGLPDKGGVKYTDRNEEDLIKDQFVILLGMFFTDNSWILNTNNDIYKKIDFKLILVTKTISTISITNELFDNMVSILFNVSNEHLDEIDKHFNAYSQLISKSKIVELKDSLKTALSYLFNYFISQLDWGILAKSIVSALKIEENQELINWYKDQKENLNVKTKNMNLDEIAIGEETKDDELINFLIDEVSFEMGENESPKYYNKYIIPNSDQIYKLTHFFSDSDLLSKFYIIEQVPIKDNVGDNTIFKPISPPELKGNISQDNQVNNYLTLEEKKFNINANFDYLERIKQRINDIFKYFSTEHKEKNFYNISVIEMFRKILIKLTRQNDEISTLIILSVCELFFSVAISILQFDSVSRSDISKLEELPEKIDQVLKMYKKDSGDVQEILDQLDNPLLYQNMLEEIQKEFPKMIPPVYKNQKEYNENNKEINLTSEMQISRKYLAEAEFLIKEIRYEGYEAVRQDIIANSRNYRIESQKLNVLQKIKFTTQLPEEINLSFNTPFNNLYCIIVCKTCEKYPTYRCSTRFNKSVNIFGCEINVK